MVILYNCLFVSLHSTIRRVNRATFVSTGYFCRLIFVLFLSCKTQE